MEFKAIEGEAREEWCESTGLGDEPVLSRTTVEGPPAKKKKKKDEV